MTEEELNQLTSSLMKEHGIPATAAAQAASATSGNERPTLSAVEKAGLRVAKGALSEKAFNTWIKKKYGSAVGTDENGRLTVHGTTIDPKGLDWGEIPEALVPVGTGVALNAVFPGLGVAKNAATAIGRGWNLAKAGAAAGAAQGLAMPWVQEAAAFVAGQKESAPIEVLKNSALQSIVGGATGGVAAPVLTGAGKVLKATLTSPVQSLTHFIAGKPTPENMALYQALKQQGLNPPVSAVTDSNLIQLAEDMSRSSGSGKNINDAWKSFTQKLSEKGTGMLKKSVGALDESNTPKNTGAAILSKTEEAVALENKKIAQANIKTSEDLSKYGNVKNTIPLEKSASVYAEKISQELDAASGGTGLGNPEAILSKAAKDKTLGVLAQGTPKLNPRALWTLRQNIGKVLGYKGLPKEQLTLEQQALSNNYEKATLSRIADAIDEDVADAAASGNKQAQLLVDKIGEYRVLNEKKTALIKSTYMKAMNKGKTETLQNLVRSIFSNVKGPADTALKTRQVMGEVGELLGPEYQDTMRKGVMSHLLDITKPLTSSAPDEILNGKPALAVRRMWELAKNLQKHEDALLEVFPKGSEARNAMAWVSQVYPALAKKLQQGLSPTQPRMETAKAVSGLIDLAKGSPAKILDAVQMGFLNKRIGKALADGDAYMAKKILEQTMTQYKIPMSALGISNLAAKELTPGATDE